MINPIYSVIVKKANGITYHLKEIMTDLVTSHGKDDLAERALITLANIKTGNGYIKNLISLRDTVYIYADVGNGNQEVMRGLVWERSLTEDSTDDSFKLTCYDNLIYFHNSKDNFFSKKGKRTEDVIKSIAAKWGVSVSYNYTSITHGKLSFHNESIADIIVSVLNEAKKQTGADYVIRSEKGTLFIGYAGGTSQAYKIEKKNNAISAEYTETMDGMITKVLIVKAESVSKNGSDEESGKYLTVTSVKKNTDSYGTLQTIIVKGKDEELADVQKEANETLNEKSTPTIECDITAVNNPFIKKGQQVYVNTSNIKGYCIVNSIEHDAFKNIMSLGVTKL